MQHQLFATKHKIHVHQIPKTSTPNSRVQKCTMLQRHDHKFYNNDDHTLKQLLISLMAMMSICWNLEA